MSTSIVEEEEFDLSSPLLRLVPTAEEGPIPPPAPLIAKPKREPLSKLAADSLAAIASVLTVRLTMAMAVVGAFSLAVMVIRHPSPAGLVALGIFTALIGPLCWLAQKRVT